MSWMDALRVSHYSSQLTLSTSTSHRSAKRCELKVKFPKTIAHSIAHFLNESRHHHLHYHLTFVESFPFQSASHVPSHQSLWQPCKMLIIIFRCTLQMRCQRSQKTCPRLHLVTTSKPHTLHLTSDRISLGTIVLPVSSSILMEVFFLCSVLSSWFS